jgi:hypothetical protein
MNISTIAVPARLLVIWTFLFHSSALTAAQPTRETSEENSNRSSNSSLEVRFTDNSVMKLKIKEERIALMTPYGRLTIPLSDVQRIEFASRIPEDAAKRIRAAVADLGNAEYRKREAASATLLSLREKAYQAVSKAAKDPDTEVASRAEELLKKIEETIPAEMLKYREFDVIHTQHSKIAGTIEAATLKAECVQFGDVQLRLSDVLVLSTKSTAPETETANAEFGPVDMQRHQAQIGKTFTFRVTGVAAGALWGTDIYTTDSTLGLAAVHAGLLTVGQTGVIKVTVVQSPQQFVGSTRNGVTSQPYQMFPAAYRVHK